MAIVMIFFLFIFGLCVGSFLNVIIYRPPHNLSLLKGRSFCDRCKHQISWRDNIPLLSFILLRGKCRYCQAPISWQYPLVELITGVAFILVGLGSLGSLGISGGSEIFGKSILATCYLLLATCCLIVIFFTDLNYQIIPDKVVFPAIGLAILFHLGGGISTANLGGFFLSGFAAAGFFLSLFILTKGKGMGLGDVKLVFLMGLFLGFPKIIIALYLAFLTGAVIGVILILLKKKKFGEHIAFGPFLVVGTLVGMFWGEKIIELWLKIV